MFKKRVYPQEALKAAKGIIKELALKEGISEAEMRREMTTTMMVAWNSPDPKIREMWSRIPCEGEMPTPEEFILWAAVEVTKNEAAKVPLS